MSRLTGSGPGAIDLDYWLHRSEGFRVDSPHGRVGVVAELRFGTSMTRPDALAVRAGLFGRLLLIIPVEQVAEVLPQERRIVLRASPRPTALEEERFERLPEPVYARGFLRAYAEFLGLDVQQFLDEYRERLRESEPLASPPARRARRRPVRAFRPRLSGGAVVVTLVAVLVALLAWRFGGSGSQQDAGIPRLAKTPSTRKTPRRAAAAAHPRTSVRKTVRPPVVRARVARLVLTARNGRCWLDAHQASPTGKQLYTGVLEQGQTARLQGGRLWIRLGAPAALTATLNGRRVVLPSGTSNIIVTAGGISSG